MTFLINSKCVQEFIYISLWFLFSIVTEAAEKNQTAPPTTLVMGGTDKGKKACT